MAFGVAPGVAQRGPSPISLSRIQLVSRAACQVRQEDPWIVDNPEFYPRRIGHFIDDAATG